MFGRRIAFESRPFGLKQGAIKFSVFLDSGGLLKALDTPPARNRLGFADRRNPRAFQRVPLALQSSPAGIEPGAECGVWLRISLRPLLRNCNRNWNGTLKFPAFA